jgi:hypothetical protein
MILFGVNSHGLLPHQRIEGGEKEVYVYLRFMKPQWPFECLFYLMKIHCYSDYIVIVTKYKI